MTKRTIIFAVLTAALLIGCKTKERVVTVEKVKTDSVYLAQWMHDSIYLHDSIWTMIKGDTVTQYRDRYKYIYKQIHDTTNIIRVDSIPYTVTVEVEKKLTAWERMKLRFGGKAMGLLALIVAGGAGYIVYKIKT